MVKRFKTGQSRKKRRSNEGRPKKNAPLRDKGTPELQIKRIMLVNGGNPSMSTTPIDIMFERSMINQDEYNAGLIYQYLHSRVFSKPFPQSNTGKLSEPIRSRQTSSKVSKRDIDHVTNIMKLLVRENINLKNLHLKKNRVNKIVATYTKHKPLNESYKKQVIKGVLKSLYKK